MQSCNSEKVLNVYPLEHVITVSLCTFQVKRHNFKQFALPLFYGDYNKPCRIFYSSFFFLNQQLLY